MSVTTITVRGHHSVQHDPERADVTLTIGFDGADRASVVTDATALHTEITESLGRLHGAPADIVTQWSADSLRLWSDRPWSNSGERLPLVHHANADVTARFSDFTAMSDWLATLAERDGLAVNGVTWSLSHSSETALREQAQRGAVEAATAKASAYARALGLSNVRAVELADAGMLGQGGQIQPPGPLAMRAAVARDSGAGSITFTPAAVSIDATVDAKYEAS